jgi:hypothetical protein
MAKPSRLYGNRLPEQIDVCVSCLQDTRFLIVGKGNGDGLVPSYAQCLKIELRIK